MGIFGYGAHGHLDAGPTSCVQFSRATAILPTFLAMCTSSFVADMILLFSHRSCHCVFGVTEMVLPRFQSRRRRPCLITNRLKSLVNTLCPDKRFCMELAK